jgi:hypothetical protein
MNSFIIDDLENYSEGGSAEFYYLKNNPDLGFKQFKSKKSAIDAYKRQKRLTQFDLAPKLYTDVRRLRGSWYYATGWGFVTEKAVVIEDTIMNKRLKQIQHLVDEIYKKTGWKFWDCHYYNIGYVKRGRKFRLVCIDTGAESFKSDANAWGNPDPGPKCSYCLKYSCKCE